MLKTYYVPCGSDGNPTPAQERKRGTPEFGFNTCPRALRYTPNGGHVERRFVSGADDWSDGIVAFKTSEGVIHYTR